MAHSSICELFPKTFLNESSLPQMLGEELALCENGNMIFHWADFHETCDLIKEQIESNPDMQIEFERKEKALERLSLIPVWIRTEKKMHQVNMFELYESYILNQMKFSLGIDPFGPFEISFISSTGPFRTMAIAECFNKSTYKDFIMLYLLKNKIPKRDFRIRLKAKVLMECGADYTRAHLVELEQLTLNGLLFSMDSNLYLSEVSREARLRFLVDTTCLVEGSNKELSELKNYLSQFAFNFLYSSCKEDALSCESQHLTIHSSFEFLKNKKVYLFIPYNRLSAADEEKIKNIQRFVTHGRALLRAYFQNNILKKSA
jgi:hypothetical protein